MNVYILIRKLIHLLAGGIVLLYHFALEKEEFVIISGFILGIVLLIDLLRLLNKRIGNFFFKFFSPLLWAHERKTITGATTFTISLFLCTLLFTKKATVVGLLFLTLGDTIAYFVREAKGVRKKWSEIEAGLAFFIIAIIIVIKFKISPLSIGILIAGVGAIVEFIPWKFDDNLTIPLVVCPLFHFLTPF
jgi:dolichol kinase